MRKNAAKPAEREWSDKFVRITAHLLQRETASPSESVLAAYMFVYAARIWQQYVGASPDTDVYPYPLSGRYASIFGTDWDELDDVCKEYKLPAIRAIDLQTIDVQHDAQRERGVEHFRTTRIFHVQPSLWPITADARDENAREAERIGVQIRHATNWPAIKCHPAKFANLNREFYLLARNLMHGAAYSMCMYVIPSVDVLRFLHVRCDELRQRLYFVVRRRKYLRGELIAIRIRERHAPVT